MIHDFPDLGVREAVLPNLTISSLFGILVFVHERTIQINHESIIHVHWFVNHREIEAELITEVECLQIL